MLSREVKLVAVVFLYAMTGMATVGYAEDNKATIESVSSAAEKGDAVAQCNLGIAYHDGIGVEKDDKKAVLWWIKAAQQHNPDALHELHVLGKEAGRSDIITGTEAAARMANLYLSCNENVHLNDAFSFLIDIVIGFWIFYSSKSGVIRGKGGRIEYKNNPVLFRTMIFILCLFLLSICYFQLSISLGCHHNL